MRAASPGHPWDIPQLRVPVLATTASAVAMHVIEPRTKSDDVPILGRFPRQTKDGVPDVAARTYNTVPVPRLIGIQLIHLPINKYLRR